MSLVTLRDKYEGETTPYKFDFSKDLDDGESLASAVVTASVYSGTDASPSSIVSGAASISGNIVTQTITTGVPGVIYQLTCAVTTQSQDPGTWIPPKQNATGYTKTQTGFVVVMPDTVTL